MDEPDGCDDVADLLLDVATGAAAGAHRARVLRHLAGCASCRREMDQLVQPADDLLPLVPERRPPAGFTSAVLARIARETGDTGEFARPVARPARGSRPVGIIRLPRRSLIQGVAVLLTAIVTAGTVWWQTAPERALASTYSTALRVGNGKYLRAATVVTDDGRIVGRLFAYEGRPSWVMVTVTDAPAQISYQMDVIARDGRQWTVGVCLVRDDRCSAGAAIDVAVHNVAEVRLCANGRAVMVAKLPRRR
jgi:hypothetical protein